MKNITIMEKTTIEKTTIAKITATALLFFLALFTLTTCLIAQESGQARKQGWFVGVSPYFLGAEIKTTTEHTTLTERYTTVTRTLDATNIGELTVSTTDQAEGANNSGMPFYSSDYGNRAISAVEDICKDGNYDGTTGDYYHRTFDVISNTMPTTTTGATDACFNHFQGLAASFSQLLTGVIVDSTSLSFSTTSENTPLTGNGLQFGYNFEKFRVSLNSHLWSAGENKLDSQLLLLDYFLPYGLYAGGGFGTAKLDTSIGSASKTAALHFGYQHNFTNNFSLEVEFLASGCSTRSDN